MSGGRESQYTFKGVRMRVPEDHSGEFYAGDNEENYPIGPCQTPEKAIEEFKEENEGRLPTVVGRSGARYIEVDGERLIDDLAETAPENLELYEDAMDGWCRDLPRGSYDELSLALTAVLHEWLGKYKQARCWNCIEQVLFPKADSGL